MTLQPQIIDLLEASLFRPLVLVATAWLILRLLRVRHPASCHAVWTTVLVGMLLLPALSVVTPDWTWPVLPRAQVIAERTPDHDAPASIAGEFPATESGPISSPQEAISQQQAPVGQLSAGDLVVVGYLVGLFAMLTYRLMGWILLRRVVSRSRALHPGCLRESPDVLTPVAVGVLRPSVILPEGWRRWDARTKRAVLAHEFAHLRRRDTLVAGLARLVKCVFWFHPIAWWVSRQSSDLAELACDAVALQRVGDPGGYSRVLIQFASALTETRPRVALPGLAIASGSQMGRRIDGVFELSGGTMRKLARPMVWLLALGLPALSLAATVALTAAASSPGDAAAVAGQKQESTKGQTAFGKIRDASSDQRAGGATPSVAPNDGTEKFDVVSIKPCPGLPSPGSGRGQNPRFPATSPGYAHWGCVTLSELVNQAYAGEGYPLLNTANRRNPDYAKVVRGGPSWVHSDRFSVEVRAASDSVRSALTGSMLRAMLEDRFQLRLRRATEQQPMYSLTLTKSGLTLTRTAPTDCWVRPTGATPAMQPPVGFEGKPSCGSVRGGFPNGNTRVDILGITLKDFSGYLSSVTDRYVLDNTRVDGMFDISIEYAPDEHTRANAATALKPGRDVAAEPSGGSGPNIFKALEALGLKLEPTKGPAEYLVIVSVQKPRPDAPSAIQHLSARVAGPGR